MDEYFVRKKCYDVHWKSKKGQEKTGNVRPLKLK
jgi:hypothetical protein